MAEEEAPAVESESSQTPSSHIKLISYPKIVFLYPTFLAAMFCGFYMLIAKPDLPENLKQAATAVASDSDVAAEDKLGPDEAIVVESHGGHVCARIFILILLVNLVVIAFDFPRTTSLTLFFFGVGVIAVLWSVFRLNPGFLPIVGDMIASINPHANATMYFFITLILGGLFIGVWIAAKFDYWEVRPNELLHHHGFLSDLERFAAPNLRISKEINDVFEYLLLRSGRLILQPSNERRAVVLENVFFINKKESDITRMLGAVQVQVREG